MRKSISYLTSIRHDVDDTAHVLHELSVDFEALSCSVEQMTPEQVRLDKAQEHRDLVKAMYATVAKIRKTLTQHNLAADKLQTFF